MKKANLIKLSIALILAVAFVLIPLPAADLYIRVQFDQVSGDSCQLYYATRESGGFTGDQFIASKIDYEKQMVTFKLDKSLEGQLTQLRLDFPNNGELFTIRSVTASSAGIVQENYNPCHIFGDGNVTYINDAEMSVATAAALTYIRTGTQDPYVVLSQGVTDELQSHYSHFVLTRICICLLIALGWFLNKKNIFSTGART